MFASITIRSKAAMRKMECTFDTLIVHECVILVVKNCQIWWGEFGRVVPPPNGKVQKSAIFLCKLPGIQNHYVLKSSHHILPKKFAC